MGEPTITQMSWVYGVTTVPARIENGLLERTLISLRETGFANPRLFVDGAESVPGWLDEYAITLRHPTIRTPAHWTLALWELYLRDPTMDRYAIFQDDLVCVKNMKRYLERVPYPEKGYLNLNTFPENEYARLNRHAEGQHPVKPDGFYPSNQRGRMAVELVLSNEACKTLLCAPHMVERVQSKRRHICIDGGVVTAMKKQGWQEFVHEPSLTWHTGDESTMGHKRQPAAQTFPGEDFDALTLLKRGEA